jgi:hypothetical protein
VESTDEVADMQFSEELDLPTLATTQSWPKPALANWQQVEFFYYKNQPVFSGSLRGKTAAPLKRDHGRRKMLRWMSRAINDDDSTLRETDIWEDEEYLVTLPEFASRWEREFNDQDALVQQEKTGDGLTVTGDIIFAPLKETLKTADSDHPTAVAAARVLKVKVNLVAYDRQHGQITLLQEGTPLEIHNGNLEHRVTYRVDPAAWRLVARRHDLLGLQIADYEINQQIYYQQWKKWRQQNLAQVVISTPERTQAYYLPPQWTLFEVLKRFDPQLAADGQQIIRWGTYLVAGSNTGKEGLRPLAKDAALDQGYLFYTSHDLFTKLVAGQRYFLVLASRQELQESAREWSPWSTTEISFRLDGQEHWIKDALRFERPLERGDLLDIRISREMAFRNAAVREEYFNKESKASLSGAEAAFYVETLPALRLAWALGDRRFPVLAGAPLFSLTKNYAQETGRASTVRLHYAAAYLDWDFPLERWDAPIEIHLQAGADPWWQERFKLLAGKYTESVKLKITARVWRKR